MKKVFISIVILIILATGAFGGYTTYNRYYNSIGAAGVVNPSLTVQGEYIVPYANNWTFPVLFQSQGKTVAQNFDIEVTEFEGEGEPLEFTIPENNDSTATIGYNNELIASGTAQEILAHQLVEPGIYSYNITLYQGNETDGEGSFSYTFSYTLVEPKLPPSISISSTDVVQGDAISVYLHNLDEGVTPQITSDLGNTLFTESDGVHMAIIPTGYLVSPGAYTATVTAGDFTQQLDINVQAHDYGTQSFNMDSSSYELGDSAEASAEYRANIYPLYETKDEQRYWEGVFLMPAEGRISSEYGLARYINGSFDGYHGGIDIAAGEGTPIIAPNNAKVEFAGFLQLSGNTIVLDYGGGLKAYFFHLHSIDVSAGDMVAKGDYLGEIGTTGFSTGNHLHYQLQINGYAMNPWPTFDGTSGIFEENTTANEIN